MNEEAKQLADDLFDLADASGDGNLEWTEISSMFDKVSDDNLDRAVDIWVKLVDRMFEKDPFMEDFFYSYDQVLGAASELLFEGGIEYIEGCFA